MYVPPSKLARMAKVFQRNGIWYLDYFDAHGQRVRCSTHLRKKSQAKEVLAARLNEVRLVKAGLLTPQSELRTAPMEQHIQDYVLHMEAQSTGAKTLRENEAAIRDYVESQRVRRLDQMTRASGVAWLNALKRRTVKDKRTGQMRPYAGRSINKRRSQIRAFGYWLEDEDRIQKNPFRKLPLQQENNRGAEDTPRHLTAEEFRALLSAVKPYYQLLYLTAAVTGLRRNEIATCPASALHLGVEGGSGGQASRLVLDGSNTKNKHSELVGLPFPLAVELHRLQDPSHRRHMIYAARAWSREGYDPKPELLFPTVPIGSTFQRHRKRAGIAYRTSLGIATFHSLRKTLASSLAETGIHITTAKDVMRHSSIQLTAKVYTLIEESKKEDAREAAYLHLTQNMAHPLEPPT